MPVDVLFVVMTVRKWARPVSRKINIKFVKLLQSRNHTQKKQNCRQQILDQKIVSAVSERQININLMHPPCEDIEEITQLIMLTEVDETVSLTVQKQQIKPRRSKQIKCPLYQVLFRIFFKIDAYTSYNTCEYRP